MRFHLGRKHILFLFVAVLLAAVGCDDSTISGPEDGFVAVALTPEHPLVGAGKTIQFQARVIGSSRKAVTWSVDGGEAWGTINEDGLYTAPSMIRFSDGPNVHPSRVSQDVVIVRAAWLANPSVTDSAVVSFDAPDFSLQDLNPNSATFGQNVSPGDFVGSLSVWYFAYATS